MLAGAGDGALDLHDYGIRGFQYRITAACSTAPTPDRYRSTSRSVDDPPLASLLGFQLPLLNLVPHVALAGTHDDCATTATAHTPVPLSSHKSVIDTAG